jgi:hypothetical protein
MTLKKEFEGTMNRTRANIGVKLKKTYLKKFGDRNLKKN